MVDLNLDLMVDLDLVVDLELAGCGTIYSEGSGSGPMADLD